jgi:arylsulfatase A-like enzyme
MEPTSCLHFYGWLAGVLHKLDESVGKVVGALQEAGMLQNCIVVFTTDNGGPAAGFNINAASNWPLRGVSYGNN